VNRLVSQLMDCLGNGAGWFLVDRPVLLFDFPYLVGWALGWILLWNGMDCPNPIYIILPWTGWPYLGRRHPSSTEDLTRIWIGMDMDGLPEFSFELSFFRRRIRSTSIPSSHVV
jgi:hypothetical protein